MNHSAFRIPHSAFVWLLLLATASAETEYRQVIIPIVDGVVGDPLVTRYRGPVSAEQIGLVANNSTEAIREANTAALLAYHEAAAATPGQMPSLHFGSGSYHLEGKLDIESRAYRAGFYSAHYVGTAGSNYAAQHLVNQGSNPNVSKIVIWGMDAADVWWQERVTNAGSGSIREPRAQGAQPVSLRFENLVFEIPTGQEGNLFYLGDLAVYPTGNTNFTSGLFRGLSFNGCYFEYVDHPIKATAGGWITDEDDEGWVLTSTRPFAIKLGSAYDVSIVNCGCRGFFTGLHAVSCDSPKIDGWRTLLVPQPILITGTNAEDPNWNNTKWAGRSGVPGRISNVYSESDPCGPVFLSGMINNYRREYGYSSLNCNQEAHKALPDGVTWTIAIGSTYIQLANLPEGRDADDYFLDFTAIRVIPSEDYEPPRDLMITQVDGANDRLYFAGADNVNYFPAEVTGDHTELERHFASTIFGGSRMSVSNVSYDNNEETTLNTPKALFVPYRCIIDVSGVSASGFGGDPYDLANHAPRLAMATGGTNNGFESGVNWFGGNLAPNHPRCHVFGLSKSSLSGLIGGTFNTRFDTVFRVGEGQMNSNSFGKLAVFHPLTEEDGRPAWGYKMSALSQAWQLAPLRIDPATGNVRACTVTARIYLDAAMDATSSNTVTLYDGTTSHNTSVDGLDEGWHDVTWIKTSGGLGLPASANLYLLQGATRNVFVEYVGINWE